MLVLTPPGDYIGRIQQQWTFMVPFFLVRDVNDDVKFVIEGPVMKPCINVIDAEFKVGKHETKIAAHATFILFDNLKY